MSLYYLENENLKIAVDSHGAELSSVFSKRENREYLWQGDPAFWGRKSPVLFPVVGKYRGSKTTYNGVEYSLGQHGFARDSEFSLLTQTEEVISFELCADSETLSKYPFEFRLICSFKLTENRITVGWQVENADDKTMYFSIGAHPVFYCEKGKTVLTIKNGNGIKYNLLNGDGLYTYEKHDIAPFFTVNEEIFDNDALIIENSGVDEISLSDNGREYLSVKFDAPLFGIWSPAKKNAPFVCIEPWHGRCDAFDFSGDLTEREWGNSLETGEKFCKEYEITVNGKTV